MVNVDGLDNIIELLQTVDYKWVTAGIGCLLIYWICDILTLHIPIKRMYKTQPITNSIKVAMLGQLFNNITHIFVICRIMSIFDTNHFNFIQFYTIILQF